MTIEYPVVVHRNYTSYSHPLLDVYQYLQCYFDVMVIFDCHVCRIVQMSSRFHTICYFVIGLRSSANCSKGHTSQQEVIHEYLLWCTIIPSLLPYTCELIPLDCVTENFTVTMAIKVSLCPFSIRQRYQLWLPSNSHVHTDVAEQVH